MQAPACFDEPGFFYQMAMRAAVQGVSPDLLFFVFYFQPVSVSAHACQLLFLISFTSSSCRQKAP